MNHGNFLIVPLIVLPHKLEKIPKRARLFWLVNKEQYSKWEQINHKSVPNIEHQHALTSWNKRLKIPNTQFSKVNCHSYTTKKSVNSLTHQEKDLNFSSTYIKHPSQTQLPHLPTPQKAQKEILQLQGLTYSSSAKSISSRTLSRNQPIPLPIKKKTWTLAPHT